MVNFGDHELAIRFRKVIKRELANANAELFNPIYHGKTVPFTLNVEHRSIDVILPGDSSPLPCRLSLQVAPVPTGNQVVEVQKINQSYWVTKVLSGDQASLTTLTSDFSLHLQKSFLVLAPEEGAAPVVAARFATQGMVGLTKVGFFDFMVYQNFATAAVKHYQYFFEYETLPEIWTQINPVAGLSYVTPEVFQIYIRRSDVLELGIARTAAGLITPGPYYFDLQLKGPGWQVIEAGDSSGGTGDSGGFVRQPVTTNRPLTVNADTNLTAAINAAMRVNLKWWLPSMYPGSGPTIPANGNEHTVRPLLAVAFGSAAALTTGRHVFGSGALGTIDIPFATVQASIWRILDGVSQAHISQVGGVWGNHWQSAQWTTMLVAAARLQPPSQTVIDRINQVVAHEANRLLQEDVLFWRTWEGEDNYLGDTKAEENAWNGAFLVIAAAFHSSHTNAAAWYRKGLHYCAAAVTMPSDKEGATITHGNNLQGMAGYNVNDDGSVVNHGYLNPHYTASLPELIWGAAAILGYLWYQIPEGMLVHSHEIYRYFDTPQYNGATIYTPGSPQIWYPEGWSGGTWRMENFLTADVMAHTLGQDAKSKFTAHTWLDLHLDDLIAHQQRFTTGQTYLSDDSENDYPGKEMEVLRHLGFQVLGASMPQGAWDIDRRVIPFAGPSTAVPTQNIGIGLYHSWDISSLGSTAGAITVSTWVDTGDGSRPLLKNNQPVLESRASGLGVAFPANGNNYFMSGRPTPTDATYMVAIDGVSSEGRPIFYASGFEVWIQDTYWQLRYAGTQAARTFNITKTADQPVIIAFSTSEGGSGKLYARDNNSSQGPWYFTGKVPNKSGMQIGANVSVPVFGARMWGEVLSDQRVMDEMGEFWSNVLAS